MEPRVRAGLISGGGAALATFLLSFALLCIPGPFIAALGGFNAGMQVGRNPQFAARAGREGAVAGLYAGLVVAVAQMLGMMLTFASLGNSVQLQIAQMYPQYSAADYRAGIIFLIVFSAVLEIGITVGCGAWGATWAAKRIAATQPVALRRTYAPPASVPPPAPRQPPPDLPPLPAPPAIYPPPPSFYGLPDAPQEAAAPPDDTAV